MNLPAIMLVVSQFAGPAFSAVTLASFDDFQAGNTAWQNGYAPGIVSLGGGPGGPDDYFLQVPSYGRNGVSSRLIIFNQLEWGGDYIGAGVEWIEMDLANFGPTDLSMRIAFRDANGGGYVSLEPLPLPADMAWRHFVFPLTAGSFAAIGTSKTFVQSLSNVAQFRILSQGGGPPTSLKGDSLDASLGIDNVRTAVPEPSATRLALGAVAFVIGGRRLRGSAAPRGGATHGG